MSIAPGHTLYIKNLQEKLRKSELRRSLYALFSQFGPILDIVARKTQNMRGQAFVVFGDISAAQNAIREMQGFSFFGKELNIEYSKTKSDVIAKMDGTFVPRQRKTPKTEGEGGRRKRKATENPEGTPANKKQDRERKILPTQRNAPPNKILFIQNIPDNATVQDLEVIFGRMPGFVEVRMVPGVPGIAFVEYANQMQSGIALNEFQHLPLGENKLVISYQKQ
eukprot:TRINITY_DN2395_c0_g1_i2.p1 TRINITY_DN2395_c0_g1~~TRINITY_DN2395_c0_g1_i2.p1  ORF type:complete len:223 (-),score=55.13 TRINITY_DN2395_c0_g1_i2:120-788(-)